MGCERYLFIFHLFVWVRIATFEQIPSKEYTLFSNTHVSWNHAAELCRNRSMELIKLDSHEVLYALSIFFNNKWKDKVEDFWTGLHYINHKQAGSTETSSWELMWHDCTPLGTFSLLKSNRFADTRLCVEAENTDANPLTLWESDKCKDGNQVLCERITGKCTQFAVFDNTTMPIIVPINTTVESETIEQNYTREQCEKVCLNTTAFTFHCQALSYNPDSFKCSLHFAPSIEAILLEESLHTGNLYTRFCFEAKLDETPPTGEQYPTELQPVSSCSAGNAHELLLYKEENTTISSSFTEANLSFKTFTEEVSKVASDNSGDVPHTSLPTVAARNKATTTVSAHESSTTNTAEASTTHTAEASTNAAEASTTTAAETSTAITAVVSRNIINCSCNCLRDELSTNEKQEMMQAILESLTIDKHHFASSHRKYSCAHDHRISAQGIGYAGVMVLVCVFGSLVLLDSTFLYREFSQMIKNISEKR